MLPESECSDRVPDRIERLGFLGGKRYRTSRHHGRVMSELLGQLLRRVDQNPPRGEFQSLRQSI
ncbi:hypothetical protein AN216_17195 [Streptomyces oceani]|uniref:Uncharacterized protein n=1 Tax=Streptomyces oceani TaxID=1075402 RepID=A0A1E7JZ73_9ACTN|nr:hypothetical protein AN216_17195 [Streptomyces oceani]